ncbi:MAG: hypothetical protein KDA96_00355 [Planctomycetaceae bacterium]|nr:hypothetical protein [Planctomycetaceae bacterium]
MAGIHHLFPPDEFQNLPTWRFVLHFVVTPQFNDHILLQVFENLSQTKWDIIRFPDGIDQLGLNDTKEVITIPIEVSESDRSHPDSVERYEADFWKLLGNVMCDGFGDIYYEAVDWHA